MESHQEHLSTFITDNNNQNENQSGSSVFEDSPLKPINICVVGTAGSGKTSFVNIVSGKLFPVQHTPTIAVDVQTINEHEYGNKPYSIQLWDMGSSEKYNINNVNYFKRSCATIVILDPTNEKSLDQLPKILNEVIIGFEQSKNQTKGYICICLNKTEENVTTNLNSPAKFKQENVFDVVNSHISANKDRLLNGQIDFFRTSFLERPYEATKMLNFILKNKLEPLSFREEYKFVQQQQQQAVRGKQNKKNTIEKNIYAFNSGKQEIKHSNNIVVGEPKSRESCLPFMRMWIQFYCCCGCCGCCKGKLARAQYY